MNLNEIFEDAATSVKLEFLYLILSKNEDIKNQFTEYCKSFASAERLADNPEETEMLISKECSELKKELEKLDFEDIDWEDYVPRQGGYIPDYEAAEYYAEDLLTAVFDDWKEQIFLFIKNGQLVKAMARFLGGYDACLVVNIQGAGDVLEDLTDTLQQKHEEIIPEITREIGLAVKSADQVILSMKAIFDHYNASYRGMKNYLRYFEPVLLSLTENGQTAGEALKLLKTFNIDEAVLPQFSVKLSSFDEDKTEWLKKSEELYMTDEKVAEGLLDYYYGNNMNDFIRIARIVFDRYKDSLASYIHQHISPETDLELYKKVVWHLADRERKPALYQELHVYLDESEKQLFADGIGFDEVFKVQVLEIEKKYDEILSFVKKEAARTWHFEEIITPILNIYPHEAFDIIQSKIMQTIEKEKGRHSYQRICEWLKLAKGIASREDEARSLIHEIYNRRPALPALKDEMRKAGLV